MKSCWTLSAKVVHLGKKWNTIACLSLSHYHNDQQHPFKHDSFVGRVYNIKRFLILTGSFSKECVRTASPSSLKSRGALWENRYGMVTFSRNNRWLICSNWLLKIRVCRICTLKKYVLLHCISLGAFRISVRFTLEFFLGGGWKSVQELELESFFTKGLTYDEHKHSTLIHLCTLALIKCSDPPSVSFLNPISKLI